MREAEQWLGWKPSSRGRKLLRILRAIQRKTGEQLVHGGGSHGQPHMVARSTLQFHLQPSKVDELAHRLPGLLRLIDERIDAKVATQIEEHVGPRLKRLWNRDETLAQAIRELSKRVERISGPDTHSCPQLPPDGP